MKKRLLLCFSLATFMVFSFVRCTEDILTIENNLGLFEKEARLYFEQNASDIQTVRVGNQEECLSRSMTLSSRVITPDWQKGESVKRGAISSLEVPLTGDVYEKSIYSRSQNGESWKSISNVQTKLIIQKHDELEEMRSFVVTIIADKRYEMMSGRSLQASSYLNPKDFSGLMIVSDLEGNYLESYQFTNGKQERVALVRTSGMDEKNIRPEDIASTFLLIDANRTGIFSRSGESGGGTPIPPGVIPEVSVRYCRTCNLPVDQCPGHSKPPVIPPPLEFYCPHCGGLYCPGNCQLSGGGGSSGGSSTPSPVGPQGNLSKKAFSKDSKLTPEQWKIIEDMLNNINSDCMGGRLMGNLDGSIKLIYDKELNNAKYNHGTKTLKMHKLDANDSGINTSFFHELVHSQQTDNFSSRLNLEIEAHLATFRYAKRNRLSLKSNPIMIAMNDLDYFLDVHYNKSPDFGNIYDYVIDKMREVPTYNEEDYPENSSARNFSTAQKLSVDCK